MWRFRLLMMVIFLTASSAWAGERIALVVGIDHYAPNSPLKKARSDAKLMAEALRSNGITIVNDLTEMSYVSAFDLQSYFDKFIDRAATADEVYVYFAGHGLQHNNATYLLASDSELYNGEAPVKALLFNNWLERLIQKNPNAQRIIWLDACRDNPLNHYQYVTPSYLDAFLTNPILQKNTLLVYSATSGSKVYDNNLLAEKTSERLKQFPHLPLHQLVQEVREDINKRTKGQQVIEGRNTLTRTVCAQQCHRERALEEYDHTLSFKCANTKLCPTGTLTITKQPLSPNDIQQLVATRHRVLDADQQKGCWTYQTNHWAFSQVTQWSDVNLPPTQVATCLSRTDAGAVASWYSSLSPHNTYRLPTIEEQQLIATYFKRPVTKDQLEQCYQLGDNATCYSDSLLGVYLVRE